MEGRPILGGRYWIITDYWERLYVVPVTVVAENVEYGAFLVRWNASNDLFERYEGVWPEELYETEQAAREAIMRGALPCGFTGKAVTCFEECLSE